jgi:hypothetical protein
MWDCGVVQWQAPGCCWDARFLTMPSEPAQRDFLKAGCKPAQAPSYKCSQGSHSLASARSPDGARVLLGMNGLPNGKPFGGWRWPV